MRFLREATFWTNSIKKVQREKKSGKNMTKRKWSLAYKKSINCNKPKGFSQKQYCKYGKTKRRKK